MEINEGGKASEEEPEINITLSMIDPVVIKGDWRGTHYSEVLKKLSPKAGWALLEAYRQIEECPDNVERNAKYADMLDAVDNFCYLAALLRSDWRDPHNNLVIFENFDDNALDEIKRLEFTVTKKGRGGYYCDARFIENCGLIYTESGRAVSVVNWTKNIKLNNNGLFKIKFENVTIIGDENIQFPQDLLEEE